MSETDQPIRDVALFGRAATVERESPGVPAGRRSPPVNGRR
ncbi:hypothetical protein F4560_003855 [Saccharothrix ecbatanensis]|jgi:hypothetical protein|uniref:Uncharacterized protein n=1 Tax=Saccharothrix ecbatanensis TaxID=1105145 RepID=A0A7W9M1Q7_9PSEU|nr:hypothetical protein [Saccharothrix ecbatanensis]MBB5804087.1 hypothetical protein [Saccharothrix ecbatanensis]